MIDEQDENDPSANNEGNEINTEAQQDYDVQENEDGSATLIPKESDEVTDPENADFYENIVEAILNDPAGTQTLTKLSTEFLEYVEIDRQAREKRDEQYAEAIKRSGLGEAAPGGADFEGASKVTHPLISEATIDFAARAAKELCPPDGPVKTKIIGKSTPAKLQKADRKARHMNWQLMTQMPEFFPSLEQILTQAALSGVQYSKTYHWKRGRRNKFEYIPMDDIYVPFHAANFYSANRKTHAQHLTQMEFDERVASGLYYDYEISDRIDDGTVQETKSEEASNKVEGKEDPMYDEDGLRTVYEIYCHLELEDDAFAQGDYKYAPYIMTIDGPTERVLSIYRNWEEDDPTMMALDWIIEWPFIPWRGAYALGLGQLIGSLAGAATGALRALLDSAHVNNSPTAIKLKGAQMSGQSEAISITQIHEIDAAPGIDDIRKIAMPLPFNPPSPVLLELLGIITEYGKGIVRTVMEANQEYSPNMPVGTEMSRVEQGMVVYSSIHRRMHESMRRQLAIVHRLNALFLEDNDNEKPQDPKVIKEHANDADDETSVPLAYKSDYEGEMDVQPVSDPNIFTEVQRFSQMQTVDMLIQKAPQLYDVRAFHKRMLQLLKVPGIEELMPEPPHPQDENPVTENIKMAFGQPAVVLPDQDHLAHLQVLIDFMNDPIYGENPAIRPKFLANAVNHAVQHMLFLYGDEVRILIEKAAGKPIKELTDDDPELKQLMSKTAAAASPMALQNTTGLLQKIVPILTKAVQDLQAMAPPTPMDPAAAALQAKQIDAQTKSNEIQVKAQSDAQKAQIDKQIADEDNQTKQSVEAIKSHTDLVKNEEDNATAMSIAEMRMTTGASPGNIKDGTALGKETNP